MQARAWKLALILAVLMIAGAGGSLVTPEVDAGEWESVCCGPGCGGTDYCIGSGDYDCCKGGGTWAP